MVLGGYLSDRFGRRRTLAVYLALMSLPVLYLMWVLQQHGWVMPVAARRRTARAVPRRWSPRCGSATLAYAVRSRA